MNIPCILVVHHDSLWSRVLERPGIWPGQKATVVVCEATTVQDLLREINLYSADIVLMSESTVVAGKENLAELLMVYPKLRVIVASDDSNWVHIYYKKDILLSRLNDLFNVIDVAND